MFRDRPALFVGTATLANIVQFMSGYTFACEQKVLDSDSDPFCLPRDLNDWIAYRLHLPNSNLGFQRMIENHVTDEASAIATLFELLDQYRSRKAIRVAIANGINRHYRQIDEEGERTCNYPTSVDLVVYTSDPGFFVETRNGEDFPGRGFYATLDNFESTFGVNRGDLEFLDKDWRCQ